MVVRQYKVLTFGETKRLIGLDDVLRDRIFFPEKLYVFSKEGRKIGRFSISVDEDKDKEKGKVFLVHISNKATVDGTETGTTMTGTVSQSLKTVEEIRHEYSAVETTGRQERSLYLLREATRYYCSVRSCVNNITFQKKVIISFAKSIGLVGEASNVILMRAIAVRGFQGILCLKTVLGNGTRVRNYYVSKLSEQVVNRKKMEVMIIYRNITDHNKYHLTLTAALTRAGQLVYLFWSNTKSFLHVDPDLQLCGEMANGLPEIWLASHWNRDPQMHSFYLDRMTQQKALYRSYRLDAPDLKRVVADFLQYLLLLRPDDVLCFAVSYFTAFGQKPFDKCGSRHEESPSDLIEVLGEEPSDFDGHECARGAGATVRRAQNL